MCCRYTHRHTWPEIVALYRLTQLAVAPNGFGPRYNIAPTQRALVIRERGGKREAAMFTLIEAARLNGIDPRAWLADVLGRINDQPASRLGELLAWRWRGPEARLAA